MKKPEKHLMCRGILSFQLLVWAFLGIKPPVSSKRAEGAFSPHFLCLTPEPSLIVRVLPRDMGSEQGNRTKQCGRHAPSSGVGGWRNLLKPGYSSATAKPKQRDALEVTASPLPSQTPFSCCFLQQEECERCSRPEEYHWVALLSLTYTLLTEQRNHLLAKQWVGKRKAEAGQPDSHAVSTLLLLHQSLSEKPSYFYSKTVCWLPKHLSLVYNLIIRPGLSL